MVFGPGRVAERVVHPVVEGADAGEEADRRGDERGDEDERLREEDRVPAGSPADEDDDPEADPAEEDEHPGPAQEPGAEEQPSALKTERPAADGVVVEVVEVVEVVVDEGGAAVFPCFLSQESNAAGSITTAWLRMSEWPSPHSSVHSSGKVPRRVGVMWSCVTRPGTTSSFWENCGTKTEWMTS